MCKQSSLWMLNNAFKDEDPTKIALDKISRSPRYSETDLTFIVPRVLELTYTSHSMAPFARDLGYEGPPFAWDEDRRATLRAELDAWYALAYGEYRTQRLVLAAYDVLVTGGMRPRTEGYR